jgi:hypothetical protein
MAGEHDKHVKTTGHHATLLSTTRPATPLGSGLSAHHYLENDSAND